MGNSVKLENVSIFWNAYNSVSSVSQHTVKSIPLYVGELVIKIMYRWYDIW